MNPTNILYEVIQYAQQIRRGSLSWWTHHHQRGDNAAARRETHAIIAAVNMALLFI